MSLASVLDKTLDVRTPLGGKSPTGAATRTLGPFETRLSGVPCAVWPASARTVESFARRDLVAEHEVATAQDIRPAAGDVLVIGGRTYPVLGHLPFDNAAFGEPVYVTVVGQRNQSSPAA